MALIHVVNSALAIDFIDIVDGYGGVVFYTITNTGPQPPAHTDTMVTAFGPHNEIIYDVFYEAQGGLRPALYEGTGKDPHMHIFANEDGDQVVVITMQDFDSVTFEECVKPVLEECRIERAPKSRFDKKLRILPRPLRPVPKKKKKKA